MKKKRRNQNKKKNLVNRMKKIKRIFQKNLEKMLRKKLKLLKEKRKEKEKPRKRSKKKAIVRENGIPKLNRFQIFVNSFRGSLRILPMTAALRIIIKNL